ncbi:cell cycle regulator of non-homologous end joining [Rhynochetos jubatus]
MVAGARRRLLPGWMGAAGSERAAAVPPAQARRRRRRRQAAGSRAAVYCMNEAELLDVALAVLAENLQCGEGEKKARSGSEEERELQPTPKDAPGSAAGAGSSRDRGAALCSPPGEESTGWEDSEDDALKYVREIFFS